MTTDIDQQQEESQSLGRSRMKTLVQVVGFGLSIAALGWAMSSALKPENRAQLEKLQYASASQIMMLVGLAFASVAINGLIFWIVIRPVHRIRVTDVISTNAIATFLAYLPFKISVVARVTIHKKRDGVPILTIGAWFAGVAILLLAVLVPMSGVSFLLKEVNVVWWGAVFASAGVAIGLIIAVSKVFYGEKGIERLNRVPIVRGFTSNEKFLRMHAGFDMLASPSASIGAGGLRVLDVLAFAGRFVVASAVLGLPITGSDALLLGSVYFLIGVLSPFGMLGTREAGTIGAAALFGVSAAAIGDSNSEGPIAAAVVFISAIEAIVNLGCAGFGVAWLRIRPGLEKTS